MKKENTQTVRGYKVFNPDFTCRGHKFEVGKTYTHNGEIKICNSGFHFCTKASHCFSYYDFNSDNIVCEVEAIGKTETHDEDSKVCTDKITIIRQLSWQEVLTVSNDGKNNTGHSNTGDRNTGDSNTGDRNTGYSNTGDRNTGAFCTGEPAFTMFNKPCEWTAQDFLNSDAWRLICNYVDTKLWIPDSKMTDEEKKNNIGWKNAEGYYKDIPYKEAFTNAWHNWSEENRKVFMDLPNFSAEIFEEITGVKVK